MPDLSPEAKEQAMRRIVAAAVFSDYAEQIAAAVDELPAGHVLVAIVDSEHEFTGTHHVSTEELVERVPQLEADGFAMVFSPGADARAIRKRTDEWASIAEQRIAAIDRIRARMN